MFEALEQSWKNTDQANLITQLYQGKIKDYVKCLQVSNCILLLVFELNIQYILCLLTCVLILWCGHLNEPQHLSVMYGLITLTQKGMEKSKFVWMFPITGVINWCAILSTFMWVYKSFILLLCNNVGLFQGTIAFLLCDTFLKIRALNNFCTSSAYILQPPCWLLAINTTY